MKKLYTKEQRQKQKQLTRRADVLLDKKVKKSVNKKRAQQNKDFLLLKQMKRERALQFQHFFST